MPCTRATQGPREAAGMPSQPVTQALSGLAAAVLGVIVGLASASGQAPPSPPPSGGPVEAGVIEDLVAANRILADQGVLDGYGHVSVRHDRTPSRFLMSRSLAPELVTAADIMEYDLDSDAVDPRGRTSYLERFIHGEIYKARPDVKAVVHSHSPSVIPFGVTQVPLRPLYHMAAFLGGGRAGVRDPRRRRRDRHAGAQRRARHGAGRRRSATAGRADARPRRVVVGPSVQVRSPGVYTEINARLQAQAMALGGTVTYLERKRARRPTSPSSRW